MMIPRRRLKSIHDGLTRPDAQLKRCAAQRSSAGDRQLAFGGRPCGAAFEFGAAGVLDGDVEPSRRGAYLGISEARSGGGVAPDSVPAPGDDDLRRAVTLFAPVLSGRDDIRVVGTASSWLRGIALPVGDVDVLAGARDTVDELHGALARIGGLTRMSPRALDEPGFLQYFAALEVGGVVVEVSTVESGLAVPLSECAGAGPWEHVDHVAVGGHVLALVASELRLQSEVRRTRRDRWVPIGRHLARHGYDEDLLMAASDALPVDLRPTMRHAVATSTD
jgi:hypothetical protein